MKSKQYEPALGLDEVLIAIALAPVARSKPASPVSVTPKGQKLVNHYRGGYHFFTVAE